MGLSQSNQINNVFPLFLRASVDGTQAASGIYFKRTQTSTVYFLKDCWSWWTARLLKTNRSTDAECKWWAIRPYLYLLVRMIFWLLDESIPSTKSTSIPTTSHLQTSLNKDHLNTARKYALDSFPHRWPLSRETIELPIKSGFYAISMAIRRRNHWAANQVWILCNIDGH